MLSELIGFREWFHGYEDQYVIVGGTACLLLMENEGIEFRATKDIDLVLIIEAIMPEFISKLWEYVIEGGYEHRNNIGCNQCYRFSYPKKESFPFMIELFTRHLMNIEYYDNAVLTPFISEDDVSDFSAILLDDEYYGMICMGKIKVDGISVLAAGYLILLKTKAWLDLSYRKNYGGENVDSKNIRKHKNDVFRLSTLLKKGEIIYVPLRIYQDFHEFVECMKNEKLNTKQLGLTRSKESILEQLELTYIVID